jgi:hypothetical protein
MNRGQAQKMDKRMKKNDVPLLKKALEALREHGVETELDDRKRRQEDQLIKLRYGGQELLFATEVRRGLRPVTLGAVLHLWDAKEEKTLLVADYVTPQMADELRHGGVNFIDTAGNAYLEAKPLLVWVKGQRPRETVLPPAAGRVFQPAGLQLLFTLLCNPNWADLPYRDLAKLAGVAHGTVGLIMADLPKMGFLAGRKGNRRLQDVERLVQQWVEGYARTLKPKLLLGRFAPTRKNWIPLDAVTPDKAMIGGEWAAAELTGYLKPQTATFYLHGDLKEFVIANRLQKDPDGPVECLRHFWNFEYPWNHPGFAPPLLIYADLLAIGDKRTIETGRILHDRLITERLGQP